MKVGVGVTLYAFYFWVLVAPMRNVWLPYQKLASILVGELCSPSTPRMTFRPLFKVIFITLSQEGPNRWEAIFRAELATDVLRKSLRHHLWKSIWWLSALPGFLGPVAILLSLKEFINIQLALLICWCSKRSLIKKAVAIFLQRTCHKFVFHLPALESFGIYVGKLMFMCRNPNKRTHQAEP